MATEYVATLRLTFRAEDDVEAQLIAELARERAESELDTEDDADEAILTQVTSFAAAVEPRELLTRLVLTRNDLIRTRYRECYDLARELDRLADALQKRLLPHEVTDYDFGRFPEVAQVVLLEGGNPSV